MNEKTFEEALIELKNKYPEMDITTEYLNNHKREIIEGVHLELKVTEIDDWMRFNDFMDQFYAYPVYQQVSMKLSETLKKTVQDIALDDKKMIDDLNKITQIVVKEFEGEKNMKTINEKIMENLRKLYPHWVESYVHGNFQNTQTCMGVYEVQKGKGVYWFSDGDYWKNENTEFLEIENKDEILYIPQQEYDTYQKEVLNVLESELEKSQEERDLTKVTNALVQLGEQYGYNKRKILEYSGHNESVGALIFKNCKGMYPFTVYSILDDVHRIGEYKGMVFETFGKRPEEFIYEVMYQKNHPDVSFVDFVQNEYDNESLIKGLIRNYQKLLDKPIEKYRYYSVNRPIQMGGVPKENMVEYFNFGQKEWLPNFTKEVWGYVEYSKPLSNEQLEICELLDAKQLSPLIQRVSQEENLLEQSVWDQDGDAFEVHNQDVIDKLMIVEDSLAGISQKDDVFVVGSWCCDTATKNTGVDYVSTVDYFYNDMQELNFKNGMDLMVNPETQSIVLYGYGDAYTQEIEGKVFEGMDYERYEYNFCTASNLPKSMRNKVYEMLDSDEEQKGFASLTTNQYKMLEKYSDLNKDILARFVTDDEGELADTRERTKDKEDYDRER